MDGTWFEMLLETCGYLATFIGVMMEGEVSLVTSVVGAKAGYYNFYLAMFFAWLGAWVADWFKFLLANKKGKSLLAKKPKLEAKIDKMSSWYDKYPEIILLVYKMFFGLTTVILVMAGLRNVSYIKFAMYSAISVAIWTALLGGFAFHCADALLTNIEWVSNNVFLFISALALIAGLTWFFVKRPFRKACLEEVDGDI